MDDASYTDELLAAKSVPGIHAACKQLAVSLGFDWFLYAVRIPVSLSQPFHFSLNGYPRAWRDRYDSMGYIKIDPIVSRAFASAMPLVWDEVDRRSTTIARFFDEASEFGLSHGITAPVYGRRGDLALMSLARREAITRDRDMRFQLQTRAHWFATVVHETVRRVVLDASGTPIAQTNLTEREKDCLMWAADGKTSTEIARLLEISERTVFFHIENAGTKLGARGRHNIIARAIALGEVELSRQALRVVKQIPVTHETSGLRSTAAGDLQVAPPTDRPSKHKIQ